MFQNLRTNSQIYIFHKKSTPYVEQGSVVSVSMPRPKYPSAPQFGQYPQVEMVVDVAVNVNGQNTNLQGLPAGAEIADFGQNGNIVVSCSRDAMNGEINTYRQKSVDIVNSRDYHIGIINACDKILNDLNPEFAAKQQQEKEIGMLKQQMDDMSRSMAEIVKMNKELMKQLSDSGTKSRKNNEQL